MSEAQSPPTEQYRLAIRRPVTTAMVFLTLVVFGWKSYEGLSINLMPDISYPTLTVRTEYEGAAPEDVEKLLTRPLEETLAIVPGMVQISSVSSPGLSEIVLEFTWDTDMNTAQQDVRDRLDLFEPPEEVTQNPVILRYDPTLDPIMRVAIVDTSEDVARQQERLTQIRESAERHIKSDLEGELGIAQVLVKGGREEEIQVLVDAQKLKNLGLNLDSISNSLAQQNINLSGGRLKEGKTEYLVRTVNEYKTVSEIGDTLIVTPAGIPIALSQVAEVIQGEKDRDTVVRLNGGEAVELEIYKWGDANTVQVCNKVKDLFGFDRKLSFWELAARRVERMRNAGEEDEEERRSQDLRKTLLSRLPDPEHSQFVLVSDQSRFIVASIEEVQNTAIQGGILALIILAFFLKQLRSTLIIGVSIPISIIATFVPMYMRDVSLNIMSLGGLALGVGMLVDNSIVVLESIFRCTEEGDGTTDSANRGTNEVGGAVTASTLTTVAVFLPLAFVEGIAGQLFGDLALTVTFSLLASLLVALYLIPMVASRPALSLLADRDVVWMLRAYHDGRGAGKGRLASVAGLAPRGANYVAAWLGKAARHDFRPLAAAWGGRGQRGALGNILSAMKSVVLAPCVLILFAVRVFLMMLVTLLVSLVFPVSLVLVAVLWVLSQAVRLLLWVPFWLFETLFNAFRNSYELLLRFSLGFSALVLLAMLGLSVHAGWLIPQLGTELIPPLKQGEFGIRMEAPPGTRIEQTEQRAIQVEKIVRSFPVVDTVSVEVGSEKTKAESERGENVAEFTVTLRDPDENAQYQDEIIEQIRREIIARTGDEITFTLPALFSFKFAVELQIQGDDIDALRAVGQEILASIEGIPGLKDAELNMKQGYPEVIIGLDRELLAAKGLTPDQVALRLRNEVQGEAPTEFNRAGEKVDIRVRTDRAGLSSLRDLRQVSVIEGTPPIPLETVATIDVKEGPSEIRRIDQRRVALVTANVEGRDLGAVSRDIEARVSQIRMPEDFDWSLGGQNRELATSYQSLQFALLLAIFLVYVVMACQFESILHPALVLFSVPLAFIGVVYVLYLFEISLSIMVFIGGIILAGIVVNNAIVLVDYVNQLRARGMAKREAVVQAGLVRLRPILMTTLTTVLGLIPMALSSGEGAEIRRPMAVTVMAGLSSATLLTLLIIPMAYYLFGGRDKT
ncbi:MAG: efflux RND transporter permease subunit [Candidatus Hydrogenedentes bacterium]|jgi:HAE1 family hydrophobic/amphiphilic exporter-1|nr:efflux RND transporter permease subunit [Candidatus Hydrogenedentota bacterium]MDY0031631.1 efflux RND transporter permease subunit [FCB group bacterium]